MPISMDLPIPDLIKIRENQLLQHRVNFQALRSAYEVAQSLVPPQPKETIQKLVEDMRVEQQAAEFLDGRIKQLKQQQQDELKRDNPSGGGDGKTITA